MNRDRLIVILGMHRGGTSVVARSLQVLGVQLGDRLLPPVAGDNEKGYWEDEEINALNIEMLSALHSDWHFLSPIKSRDVEILHKAGFFFRAVDMLRAKVAAAHLFGFKDPRVAKLLPFWKEVFQYGKFDVNYVLVTRHPLSVVKSLTARESFEAGFGAEKIYLLWLEHIIASLTGTIGSRRVLIDYDRLMQDPGREITRMAEMLELRVDAIELRKYETEYLDNSLRHTVFRIEDLVEDKTCLPLVREVYCALFDVATGRSRLDGESLRQRSIKWQQEYERIDRAQLANDRLSKFSPPGRFDPVFYLNNYPDVANSGMDPYQHYLQYGHAEGRQPFATDQGPPVDRNDYAEWFRRYGSSTDEARTTLSARIDTFARKPLISVVMPVFNPRPEWLRRAVESVRRQIYPNWELCIADDASTDIAVRPILERYAREDARIKLVFREHNGHISAASNSALELASGEWVALLDHDDQLTEAALYWVADTINAHPDASLIYSDEDKIDDTGRRFDPYFKCDWNADLFRSHNLLAHLCVFQAALLREVGGFRQGLEGAQDYDLSLRCIERIAPGQIHHIPRVLYHWYTHAESTAQAGAAKPYALSAGELALNEHFKRLGVAARAEPLDIGMYRVRYDLPASPPLVSLIIPIRKGKSLSRRCIGSILEKTTYPNYKIVIVDNGSDDLETHQYLEALETEPKVRVLRDNRGLKYPALTNATVKLARGELVGLLNSDLEVISPEWLSEMVSHALRPEIGAVGARLWYPDDTLHHGGILLGVCGVAGYAHHRAKRGIHGYFGRMSLIQQYSAVSAACLVIRKEIYEKVGGLNETDLQVAFFDVDFCLRIREAGYRNIWTPYAELYQHDAAVQEHEDATEKTARLVVETNYMQQRWGELIRNDPAYSPNLTREHEDFSLAWPPDHSASAGSAVANSG